jgi:hypothetical protein
VIQTVLLLPLAFVVPWIKAIHDHEHAWRTIPPYNPSDQSSATHPAVGHVMLTPVDACMAAVTLLAELHEGYSHFLIMQLVGSIATGNIKP